MPGFGKPPILSAGGDVPGGRPLRRIRCWRLLLAVSVWTQLPPNRPPGGRRYNGKPPRCPNCNAVAIELEDGRFKCRNKHIFNAGDAPRGTGGAGKREKRKK